jgi:hypothetical protein
MDIFRFLMVVIPILFKFRINTVWDKAAINCKYRDLCPFGALRLLKYGQFSIIIFCLMCFIPIVRLLFSLILTEIAVFTLFRYRAYDRCDRQTRDFYYSWSLLWHIQGFVFTQSLTCVSNRTCEIDNCSLYIFSLKPQRGLSNLLWC